MVSLAWVNLVSILIAFAAQAATCSDLFRSEGMPGVPERVLEQMAMRSLLRDEALVRAFKNRQRPGRRISRTVDLTGGPKLPSRLLSENVGWAFVDQDMVQERRVLLQKYYEKVEGLRSGDTVVFGLEYDEMRINILPPREFRLGRYLGAGDTVHVFELADHPGRAIRIPFTKPRPYLSWDFGTTKFSRMAPPENHGNRVRVYEVREGFAIVDLVEGNESSQTFLSRLQEGLFAHPHLEEIANKLRAARKNQEADKLEKLIEAFEKSGTLGDIAGKSILGFRRQFTYSRALHDWVMTDWE